MKKIIEKLHGAGFPGNPSRMTTIPDKGRCLDLVQLERLEQSFRRWADEPARADHKLSRKRIALVFILIRYTGARLSEILNLNPFKDIDFENRTVYLRKTRGGRELAGRHVLIPARIAADVRDSLGDLRAEADRIFSVDPAHVRRKFYKRAEQIGIQRELGAPEVIRRSRAVELLQGNMPLPVVKSILGHSTPNLAATYVSFSDDEIRQMARYYADREDRRKTSARNAFFGKITRIRKGDVQAMVDIMSIGGYRINAAITNQSLTSLGLKPGTLVVAEVKAPWVQLYRGEQAPEVTAENKFHGVVDRITSGHIVSEIVVRIADGTELCAIITEESKRSLAIEPNEALWAVFNAFAVVLHVD